MQTQANFNENNQGLVIARLLDMVETASFPITKGRKSFWASGFSRRGVEGSVSALRA